MSTIEDDTIRLILATPRHPLTHSRYELNRPSHAMDEDEEDKEEVQPKKKRTAKKNMHTWSMLLRLERGHHAGFDDEEIKH